MRTVDSATAAIDRLLARHAGSLVVVEACATAGWVHDCAVAAGHPVKVANTEAGSWKFCRLKRKTDRDDALRLAELEAIGQLLTVTLPDPPARRRRLITAWQRAGRTAGAVPEPAAGATGRGRADTGFL